MPVDAEHDVSVTALVDPAAAGLFLEELGGQVVFDWSLALAIISTLMLLALVCIWLPQRRQHLQHHLARVRGLHQPALHVRVHLLLLALLRAHTQG